MQSRRPSFLLAGLSAVLLLGAAACGQRSRRYDGGFAGDLSGTSVSGAGDVNGDGVTDTIVGAPDGMNRFLSRSGVARVLSGKDGAVLYNFYGSAGDKYGASVSGAGDANGDGYSDLIIGAPGNGAGYAQLRSGKDGSVLHTFRGTAAGDAFGAAVGGAGDVDGDGYDDVIIGIPGFDIPRKAQTDVGSARVMSGRDGTLLHAFFGNSSHDRFGFSVSGAGYVNRDGYADLIVGAPYEDATGVDSGSARVLSGFDGAVLQTIPGGLPGDVAGWSVHGAGDVDGDGYGDLIVGLPSIIAVRTGRAVVCSGRNGVLLHRFSGGAAGDRFGFAVSGAGDVDGDGFADLIVGAPLADVTGADSGLARVLSGRGGGVLRTFHGAGAGDQLGCSVSAAGHLDGFVDVIVGAPRADPGNRRDTGSAFLESLNAVGQIATYTGTSAGDGFGKVVAKAGDVNKDGHQDIVIGAPRDGKNGAKAGSVCISIQSGKGYTPTHTLVGNTPGDEFGAAVGAAGDVNGDGYDDVIVGAPGADPNGKTDAGSAYVISGANGAVLDSFDGDAAGDQFGLAVGGAGDVDGDGFDDVVVGAPRADGNGVDSGSVIVRSVRLRKVLYRVHGGSAGDRFGWAISSIGDLNGDNIRDLIVGAPFADQGASADQGSVSLLSGRTGAVLRTMFGDRAGDRLGWSVGAAGDVNRDGTPDVIAGAPDAEQKGQKAGGAKVVSGKDGTELHRFVGDVNGGKFGSSVDGAGDVDRDGYVDLIVGAPNTAANAGSALVFSGRDGSVLHAIVGSTSNDQLGASVAGVGDVDRDGFADVIVGVDRSAGAGRVLLLARRADWGAFFTYGSACPSIDGRLPRNEMSGRPYAGSQVLITLRAAPRRSMSGFMIGFTRHRLDLSLFGMPGCWLLASPDVQIGMLTSAIGNYGLPVAVPPTATLVGATVYTQWAMTDTRGNPIYSNGGKITVGRR